MSVYGTGVPAVKLVKKDENNNYTEVLTIILPRPTKRKQTPVIESIEVTNFKGEVLYRKNEYRFKILLQWDKISVNEFYDIIKITNWIGEIWYYPDKDISYYKETVIVEDFTYFYVKDKIYYNGVTLSLKSILRRPKIQTPDSLLIGKLRTSIQ